MTKQHKISNKDNEARVITCIIQEHEKISDISEIISKSDFFNSVYGEYFQKALLKIQDGIVLDPIELCNVIGLPFLEYSNLATLYGFDRYSLKGAAKLVKEYSLKRQIKAITAKYGNAIDDADVFESLESLQAELEKLLDIKTETIYSAPVIAQKFFEKQNARLTGKKKFPKFGIRSFDELCGDLLPGEITLIGARPGMGKTALIVSAMLNMLLEGMSVGFLSLEMPLYQIMMRFMSQLEKIPLKDLRNFTKPHEILMFTKYFCNKFQNFKFCMDDTGGLSDVAIKNRLTKMKKLYDIDIAFFDYIQLAKSATKKENRNNEIGQISATFVNTAKLLDIPICALAQLNREVEKNRKNPSRPGLSDFRDSGNLEQDATTVITIHRPEAYGIDTFDGKESCVNKAELIICKQRNGETGSRIVGFYKELALFFDDNDYGTPEYSEPSSRHSQPVPPDGYLSDDDVPF